MATAICYNLIYNNLTSAFEKHGLDTITSAEFQFSPTVSGISGTCTSGHTLYFEISASTESLDTLTELNLSADYSVTSANTDLATAVTSGVALTSGSPDISASNINGVNNMKVEIVITAISPVIKVDYEPLEVIPPTSVVTR